MNEENEMNKENEDVVPICAEDEDLGEEIDEAVGFECSDGNSYITKWVEGITEGKYHPDNDRYIEGNMINIIPKKFLKDKIPTKE